MISRRMNRPPRVILFALSSLVVALSTAACGTERISIPKSDPNYAADLQAAQLFQERCAGCHTLSYAATHGSAANPRTAQAINGPDFDQRCERPAIRVLYAIENGGFSGAYMPQNVFVGQQAREVALFVARFAGKDAETNPGQTPCKDLPIGTLPPLPTDPTSVETAGVSGTPTTATTATYSTNKPAATKTKTKSKSKSKTKKI